MRGRIFAVRVLPFRGEQTLAKSRMPEQGAALPAG